MSGTFLSGVEVLLAFAESRERIKETSGRPAVKATKCEINCELYVFLRDSGRKTEIRAREGSYGFPGDVPVLYPASLGREGT